MRGDIVIRHVTRTPNALERLRGLRERQTPGHEGLLLDPCGSVRTWCMRLPIDVVYLNRDLIVLPVNANLARWCGAIEWGASKTLELAAGAAARRDQARGRAALKTMSAAGIVLATGLLGWQLTVHAATAHQYDVIVADDLTSLKVTACPIGEAQALVASTRDAEQYLREARALPSGERLVPAHGRLPFGAGDECIEYSVDLAAAAASNQRYSYLDSSNRAVATSLWLWQPQNHGANPLNVTFALKPEMQVSVPWQELDGSDERARQYSIPSSPRSDEAVSAFGHFRKCKIGVGGATLRVAILTGQVRGNTSDLLSWIRDAAANTSLAYGRFPNPSAQIIVVPVANRRNDDKEPVPFGHVIRNGGEAVQFFVNQQRPLSEFVADWTATHEFSHLLLPYINHAENWISEGLASYYQNVLMARSGHYKAEKAWRKIIEGFRRGEKAVPHLSLENAMPLGSWDGIMKTYWGGAAIFLIADAELRRQSANTASLDTVLEKLQSCCLPSSKPWRGREFFRQLDRLAPVALFEDLYDHYHNAREFPQYGGTLTQLGVDFADGQVRFDERAELAAIRRSIMAPATLAAAQVAPGNECGAQ